MGKPYYHERRAEVEKELTAEQRERCNFVPVEVVQRLIEENHFGDRWPSSGLITIVHMLNRVERIHLHGFDFFKEIGPSKPIINSPSHHIYSSLARVPLRSAPFFLPLSPPLLSLIHI